MKNARLGSEKWGCAGAEGEKWKIVSSETKQKRNVHVCADM